MLAHIAPNLARIKAQIAGRATLIAVSKTKPVDLIQAAYDAGHREFGENYVDEIIQKSAVLPNNIVWHMIGHLQSNKIGKLLKSSAENLVIQSIDSEKLVTKVNRQCENLGRPVDVMI
jgi:uncharacterized pyridoxal phosphate-containing UPF0001 family protein